MRRVLHFTNYKAKIRVLFLALAITSCNSLKRVDDDQLLIRKNSITVDSVKIVDENIESLVIQKKNATLLGYPLRLNLYNLAKIDPDSSYNAWLYRKDNRKERLDNFLSEKQTKRLGESFLVKGLSEWLKEIGEPPAVLDTALTRKTLERLNKYYSSKGYFNNTTTFKIDSLKRRQRAAVDYQIELGEPFILDSVYENIASKAIDSLYNLNKDESFVKSGKRFDIDDFEKERGRLTSVFRNHGVWNFQESAIKYDIIADTTRLGDDQKMNIELNIDDLKKRNENSVTTEEYKVFTFDKINIFTDYFAEDQGNFKFERFGNYTIYYRDRLRFRPKTLTDAVFFKKDSVYRDLDRIRTLRQITSLNVFKYPSITFLEDSTRTNLTANVYLTPRKKYSFAPNLEVTQSNISRLGLGINGSLVSRNVFKGAENLSISGNASYGLLRNRDFAEDSFYEIGGDISLNFPRIWLPLINTDKIIPNYMLPKTNLKMGTTFQKNIGLDKQTFNTILGYSWKPTDFVSNSLELLNVQFVTNLNTGRFFSVYRNTYNQLNSIAANFADDPDIAALFNRDDPANPVLVLPDNSADSVNGPIAFIRATRDDRLVEGITVQTQDSINRIAERENRLTDNNLIFTTNYTFNKNNRQGATDNSFYQFRFKAESAGNLLSAISYLIPFNQEDGKLVVFGVPYSQYIKTEFDYIKYWDLSHSNVLAMRSFVGIAVPYGNADNIPFLRSYFAGGANDNRAWRPYSLGPGRTSAANDFNEANLKLAFNLEYRFPIAGNFKGALFADAGNIWNVFDNVDDPEATFNGLSSLKDIALGSGFGIRYDFTYFVIRGDLAFKTYNPAEEQSKRWFRDYNLANSVLQIGINYPF